MTRSYADARPPLDGVVYVLSSDEIKSIIVLIKIPPHPLVAERYQFMQISLINGPTRYTMKFARVISILATLAPLGRTFKRRSVAKLSSNPYLCGWLHPCCVLSRNRFFYAVAKYESEIRKIHSLFNKNAHAISLKKDILFVQIEKYS